MTRAPDVVVVDNDDSFVHILVDYLVQLGAAVTTVRSRDVDPDEVDDLVRQHDAVLVSPGPGAPHEAGVSIPVIRAAARARTPLLGVCLGHQAIAEAYGARVASAPELRHGMTSPVVHDGGSLFRGIPDPFDATRYHSLAVVDGTVPAELVVTARTATGTIMGLRHRELPIEGVQFHPESVLTQDGFRLMANWLELGVSPCRTRT